MLAVFRSWRCLRLKGLGRSLQWLWWLLTPSPCSAGGYGTCLNVEPRLPMEVHGTAAMPVLAALSRFVPFSFFVMVAQPDA